MDLVHHQITINDAKLSYFERSGHNAVTVLLSHATGFHGRCWDGVLNYLPPNYRVIVLEHRGHGRSEKVGPYDWKTFGDDLVGFIQELNLNNLVAVGHSMGGMTVLYAAAKELSRFKELLLLDPVIMELSFYEGGPPFPEYSDVKEHPVAKRVNRWQSVDAMFEKFKSRYPFSLWKPEILYAYCQFGIEEDSDTLEPEKPFQLCCPPEVEASIYMGNNRFNPHQILDAAQLPVTVFRAVERPKDRVLMDFSKSPTWPHLASSLPDAKDVYLPYLSHFIPMQDPLLVATQINQIIV